MSCKLTALLKETLNWNHGWQVEGGGIEGKIIAKVRVI
jgi:hypothetical protein